MSAGTLVVRKRFRPEEVAAAGPALSESSTASALTIFGIALGGIAAIGILASIAIPAYQNSTIRAQVAEGLKLAPAYQAAITEALESGEKASLIDSESIQGSFPSSGKYVDFVKVVSGAIAIQYGRASSSMIAGKVSVLMPALNSQRDIVWVCGRALPPADVTPVLANASQYTTIGVQYLPQECHE
jgi:type IV pilus assembly protein PilA